MAKRAISKDLPIANIMTNITAAINYSRRDS
jgi:hypothetical protein